MKIAHSTGRRIAGLTCIALGMAGSLPLLWAIVSGARPDLSDDAAGMDAVFGLFGIAPLFAIALGAIAIGLLILLDKKRT